MNKSSRVGSWLTVLPVCFAIGCVGEIVGPSASGGDDDDDVVVEGPDGGTVTPTADGGTTPGQPDAAPQPPDDRMQAAGISIRDISVYQSVAIPIVSGGNAVGGRNAPVVEGADAMIAVFVDVDSGWQSRSIVGELAIDTGSSQEVYPVTRTVSNSSSSTVSTAFQFEVDGADITTSARYSVTLYETSTDAGYPGSIAGSRFPATGDASLGAESPNGPFHLVLVPFQYDADGSHRVPPTSGAALQEYRDRFLAMYPIAEVEVTVHSPVAYSSTIGASSGWENWLDKLTSVREQDNPPSNSFYFGVASPAASFYAFCSSGCIAGLGWVAGRDNHNLQAAVGVSFSEDVNVFTSLHEVGHTLGRSHSPCGNPSGIDQNFPYSGGKVGVWGYDALDDTLMDPSVYTDIMGYCDNQWVSDYTYAAMFDRIAYVNEQPSFRLNSQPQQYRVGLVDGAGNVTWRRYTTLDQPLHGGGIEISLRDAQDQDSGAVTGHFFPYDHLPGGMLMVPVPANPPARIQPAGMQTAAW